MHEVDASLIRSFSDEELEPRHAAAVERAVVLDEDLRARVRFETTLRGHVSKVMMGQVPAAPADLRGRLAGIVSVGVSDGVSGGGSDRTPAGSVPPSGASAPRRHRSWLEGPQRANVFAVAASVLLIAGAVLFGVFGRQIDTVRSTPPASLVAETAVFVSGEHTRCAVRPLNRGRKVTWTDPAEAERELDRLLGMAVHVLDLEPFGYTFVGAGRCGLPGERPSGHMIYTRDVPAEDGCPEAMLSIFVVSNDGQFDRGLARPLRPGEWIEAGAPPECTKTVACGTDGAVMYFLVSCNERDMAMAAGMISQR